VAGHLPRRRHAAGDHQWRRARFPVAQRLRAARDAGRDAGDGPHVEILGRVRTHPPDGPHRADDGGPASGGRASSSQWDIPQCASIRTRTWTPIPRR
jgi:hypothetical protein